MNEYTIGLRVLGSLTGVRRRVDWQEAFDSHLACERRAHVNSESYLSVFTFPPLMADHLASSGSPAGYVAETHAAYVPLDVDREGRLDVALTDTRTLVATLEETFEAPTKAILVFYSGSKGFHVEVPTWLWDPSPGVDFSGVTRLFAERIAGEAKVQIDTSIYSRVSVIRTPNSRHPATGLHKIPLTVEQLDRLDIQGIQRLATSPIPAHREPVSGETSTALRTEWVAAMNDFAAAKQHQQRESTGNRRLTRFTKSILRGECLEEGERHRHLFSAAANLAECGATLSLTEDLLTEIGRDCGLPPRDVARQIRDGHQRGSNQA